MPEMRVMVARSAEPNCERRCEWISAEGQIVSTTPGQFRTILKSLGAKKPPIFINSGGGDVRAAMVIGRMLRTKGLEVAVAKTNFLPRGDVGAMEKAEFSESIGAPSTQPAFCASACTLVFAGGAKRVVYPWSYVGVHEMVIPAHTATRRIREYLIKTLRRGEEVVSRERILLKETKISREVAKSKSPPNAYREVGAYLKLMGVSPEIVSLMRTAPPERMRWLTRTELVSTALSTEVAEKKAAIDDNVLANRIGPNAYAALQSLPRPRVESGQASSTSTPRTDAFRRRREERVMQDYWLWGGLFTITTLSMAASVVLRQRKFGAPSRIGDRSECASAQGSGGAPPTPPS